MSQISIDFVNKYFQRFDHYIKSGSSNQELLEDIKSRFCEKLSNIQGNISDSQIIDIINEIGQPEDIIDISSIENRIENIGKEISPEKKMYFRYPDRGILLGICYGIGNKLGIDPIWIRIFFILSSFVFGIGIILYMFLLFLMPVYNGNNLTRSFFEKALGIFIGTIMFFFKLFLFFVLFFLGSWVLFMGLTGMIMTPILFVDFSLDNMGILTLIPTYFKVSTVMLSVSAFIFGLILLAKSIGKNLIGAKILVLTIFMFIASIIGFFAGIYEVVIEKYFGEQTYRTQLFTTSVGTGNIDFKLSSFNDDFVIGNRKIERFWNTIGSVKFEYNSGSDMNVFLDSKVFFASKELSDRLYSQMIFPKVEIEDNTISLKRVSNDSYSTIVPGTLVLNQLIVQIPNNVKIDFRDSLNQEKHFSLANVKFSKDIFNNLFQTCKFGIIYFDTETSEFVCEKGYKNPNENQKQFEDSLLLDNKISKLILDNPLYNDYYLEDENVVYSDNEEISNDSSIDNGNEEIINTESKFITGTAIASGNSNLSGSDEILDSKTLKILENNKYLEKVINKSPDFYEFRWMDDDWVLVYVVYSDRFFYLSISKSALEGEKSDALRIRDMGTVDKSMREYISAFEN